MHYTSMIPSPFYIVFLLFLGIMLLVFAYGLFTYSRKKTTKKKETLVRGIIGEAGVCPICSMLLTDGAQIKSALFPGDKERMCHIFGCPHCHPYKKDTVERTCPVCKQKIPQEGYLIARLFERPHKKRHVHILGCTVCRTPRKR